jgi:hypothetical protein
MTPEQLKAFGRAAKELMSDPNRKDPVDPFRQPLYPAPARSLEEVHEGMRKHRIKAINAHPPEKVKRAVSAGGECGNVYFLHPCACPQRRLRQGLISVHQALRKSKCENAA